MDNNRFFKAFLKNPAKVGSIVQSSPFLVDKIIEPVDFRKARIIVEFGAGTGVVTKKILERMSKNAVLLCFENDPELCEQLECNIRNPRVKIIPDGAENLEKYLADRGIAFVDYIVSELPLAIFPESLAEKIFSVVNSRLKTGGQYVQIQYSLKSRKRIKQLFPKTLIAFVLLNVPPSFIYICTK